MRWTAMLVGPVRTPIERLAIVHAEPPAVSTFDDVPNVRLRVYAMFVQYNMVVVVESYASGGVYTDNRNVSKFGRYLRVVTFDGRGCLVRPGGVLFSVAPTATPRWLLLWLLLLLRLRLLVCVLMCLFFCSVFRLLGQDDTPFSGGCFNLEIEFPAEYPFKAPKVIHLTLAL